MRYVFDNDTISSIFKFYYFGNFPSFWKEFNLLVSKGDVVTVREVRRELKGIDLWDKIRKWANNYPKFFSNPTSEELNFITTIYSVRHFQQNIERKKLLAGKPVADPFIIAKAWLNDAIVVTQEKLKQNASAIPNICDHFGIEYMNLEGFLIRESWEF